MNDERLSGFRMIMLMMMVMMMVMMMSVMLMSDGS